MARSYDNPIPGPLGSTYSSVGGLSTVVGIPADGSVFNKSEYPALADFLDQDSAEFASLNTLTGSTFTNSASLPYQQSNSYRLLTAQTSSFVVMAQHIVSGTQIGLALWSSVNGQDWKLVDVILTAGIVYKAKAIGNSVYICCQNNVFKTDDGLTVSQVYDQGAYDIASDGTNFLIARTFNSTTSVVRTTDFVTFTTLTLPAGGVYGLEYHQSKFWGFQDGSQNLHYSSDGGTTWATSAVTLGVNASLNYTAVVNGILFYFPNVNSQGIFRYNTGDPLSAAWTASARNYNSSNHAQVMGLLYDSTSLEYVVAVGRSSSDFAYVFTTITAAGTAVTVTNSSAASSNNQISVYKVGSDCFYHILGQYMIKVASWSSGSVNPATLGSYQTPTFGPQSSNNIGTGGTEFGSRYVLKMIGVSGTSMWLSCMYENNGYFYPLYISATNQFAQAVGGTNYTQGFMYRDSSGFIVCIRVTGGASADSFFTFNPSGLRLTNFNYGTANLQFLIKAPNFGVYIYDNQSSASRAVNYVRVGYSTTNSFSFTLTTTSTPRSFFTMLNGDVVVTELSATPTTSPTYYILRGSSCVDRNLVQLYDTNNNSVSADTSLKVFKFGNVYYAINLLVTYRSDDGINFYQIRNLPAPNIGSVSLAFNQITEKMYAGATSVVIQFGNLRFIGLSAANSTQSCTPDFFKLNSSQSIVTCSNGTSQGGLRLTNSFNSDTQFISPVITSTTAEQKYIVAR